MSQLTAEQIDHFQRALLGWFKENQRHFPWRESRDPYRILLAEMLLQQTDAAKVLPIYERILERFPTAEAMVEADLKELELIMAPIGLYYRASRLKGLAQRLAENDLPESEEELLQLHGVGRYIARALLCFGRQQPLGILDTNVLRILERVFGIRSPRSRPHTDPSLWALVDHLVPPEDAKAYNLALLDLSALLCRPTKPKCEACPLASCQYREAHRRPVDQAAEEAVPYRP
jgi:A/G-specific adenine glycosylase